MFVTEDPYGTKHHVTVCVFHYRRRGCVSYTVHADGYTDFTRDAYQEIANTAKTHEIPAARPHSRREETPSPSR